MIHAIPIKATPNYLRLMLHQWANELQHEDRPRYTERAAGILCERIGYAKQAEISDEEIDAILAEHGVRLLPGLPVTFEITATEVWRVVADGSFE